ncbi:MAG: cytochrome oxidase assembly protein [Microbacterium sp. SCN 70-200]|uniref:COX15/CtaA family protein n=1 Tax=unclassified Microbacterium TaxID=2609290 RepID=UPI00086EB0C5|nr:MULTISPECIES: COX15/CtaA family protein [unclassified Microbacterium]MBN9214387.1 heme A synthase [Microbacterium sp.]ODT41018.1 MAG: cytochrome oxidase assembly protein [Microbacterium sp. SCN 70-200]OJV83811.1 MAG: heme A synthase [Microbacterium sp. 70-16]
MPDTSAPTVSAASAAQIAPARVGSALRVLAWLNFVGNVLIIATGGAVRLTGSGLGCPTWPLCTPDSLVPTPALVDESIHSLIEYGNRMMSPLLGILALVLLILVWRVRAQRRDLFVLAWIVMAGIIAQAVVGGITVLTGLNPFIVGFHYIASLVLVCVTAAIIVRLDATPGPRALVVPRWYVVTTHVATLALAVSVFFGVLTTGAGPHSGDPSVGRSGFDATVLEHVHAWPGYALLALTVVLAAVAWVRRLPVRGWVTLLLAAELVQVAVGLYQARNGLPEILVGIHMVLAALTAATMTVVVMRLKAPRNTPTTA